MAHVFCHYLEAELQGRRSDQQILKWQVDTSRCFLAENGTCPLSDIRGDGMHGHGRRQFLDESRAPLALGFQLHALDTMGQFTDGYDR